ncbi:MAG: hypothetical protein ACPL1G_06130, partial [Thermodesulfovibrionales bacterium]
KPNTPLNPLLIEGICGIHCFNKRHLHYPFPSKKRGEGVCKKEYEVFLKTYFGQISCKVFLNKYDKNREMIMLKDGRSESYLRD